MGVTFWNDLMVTARCSNYASDMEEAPAIAVIDAIACEGVAGVTLPWYLLFAASRRERSIMREVTVHCLICTMLLMRASIMPSLSSRISCVPFPRSVTASEPVSLRAEIRP